MRSKFVNQDERVVNLSNQSMARAGEVIKYLLLGDILVRGLMLDRPIVEWWFSAVLVILYGAILAISDVSSGIYDDKNPAKGLKWFVPPILIGSLGMAVSAYRNSGAGESSSNILFLGALTIAVLTIGYGIFAYYRKVRTTHVEEE